MDGVYACADNRVINEVKVMWHILDEEQGSGALCGENKPNTLSTDDMTIVDCKRCLDLWWIGDKKQ